MNEPNSNLWLTALRQRSVWARGAKLGLSVGVLQAIINQGDVWLAHDETLGTIVKTIVSPLVTFSVALVSAAATYVEKLKLNS
jgi:predicted type IV restriction endonuclease